MAKRPPCDWHPEDIKAAVRKSRFGSLVGLAKAFGLPIHACRHALREPHFGGEMAVATALEIDPAEIWPSRFQADGTRRHPPRRQWKSNAASEAGHCQNREAA